MSQILIDLGVAAVAAAAFYGLIVWANWYATDLKAASGELDEAYSAAQTLLKDPHTPMSVVRFVSFFSAHIGGPALARDFALHLLSGGLTERTDTADARQFSRDLEELTAEKKAAFTKLIVAGMISSAASDPIFSRVYLAAVHTHLSASGRKDGPPSPERANAVAADIVAKTPQRDLQLVAA